MAKKILYLLILFIVATSLALALNSSLLDGDENITGSSGIKIPGEVDDAVQKDTVLDPNEPYIFAALPNFDQQIKTSIKTADARAEIVRQYLHRFKSPLEPQADLIVTLSDQYGFDYRWLVAIAQQESNLCKRIPENSYNCWGWGIYGDKVTRFDSYEDALKRIAPQFTKIFLKGNHSKNPFEVMKTYTPPSDGSWAEGISQFFNHLD